MALYRYASYPSDLPGFEAGTEVAVENNLYESLPTLGRPTQRSPRPLHPYLINARWKLDRSEYLRFRLWWRDTLNSGMLPFAGEFCLHGHIGEYEAQFVTAPSYQSEKGGFWAVSAQIWSWKVPELSREEALSQVIDIAYLQNVNDRLERILDSYYNLGDQV